MSADDYAVVKRHPQGGYAVVTCFASDDVPDESVNEKTPRFTDVLDALVFATNLQTEYGVMLADNIGGEHGA